MARIEKLKGRWKQLCATYKGQRVLLQNGHPHAGRKGVHTGEALFTQSDMGHKVLLDQQADQPPTSVAVWKSWHMQFIN